MNERTTVFRYFLAQSYKGDIIRMSEDTGFTTTQLQGWLDGDVIPQHQTLEYICNCLFTPEFTIVCEFEELDQGEKLRSQLRSMLGDHQASPGLYAFYDSMATLLYVGKASNLLEEIYSTLRREVEITFPAGIPNQHIRRYQVTKYLSAYNIKNFEFLDYPKHVESIILRISKPRLNKQIGVLEEAYSKDEV